LSDIFMVPVESGEDPSGIAKKVKYLYDRSGAGDQFKKGDFIAVKAHFGESANKTYIKPVFVKMIIDKLKQSGASPFLTETSTLYRGKRANAFDHIALAEEHGFGFEKMKVPLIMADGLFGDDEIPVEIDGKHFSKVNIAAQIAKVQGAMVISHFTGHMATGFGGAIKNMGMGLSSRRGKLKQHSTISPRINQGVCTACGMCIDWCPEDTISIVDGKAFINEDNCIGCGECLAVCRFGAVRFNWGRESRVLQEMMAEHSAGVIKAVKGKIFYFNFLINITRNCDCGDGGREISEDIGIIAGRDIVAVEKASYDIFRKANSVSIQDAASFPVDPLFQIKHAEYLGLGSAEYRLFEL
jgi:uncharacterized Fe-S center protein